MPASRYRKAAAAAALGSASVALLAPPAGATATSGVVFKEEIVLNNGQHISACAEAIIADIADNRGYAYAKQPGGCATAVNVPAGYLGVNVRGYINNNYCGQTNTLYNSNSTNFFGVGAQLCGNPSGNQSFRTQAVTYFYKGPSYQYNQGYKVYGTYSPYQTY